MPKIPTPGEIAYEKYRAYAGNTYWHHYDRLGTHEQRAWEAAAQAVLEACVSSAVPLAAQEDAP